MAAISEIFAHETWYVGAWSHEVKPGQPLGRKLLGEDLVFFRDEGGAAKAVLANCPHRGADLAQGKVVRGAIACPFHGWRFDGEGACVEVPSQPASKKIPPQCKTRGFPIREGHGVIWFWPGALRDEYPDPPICDFWEIPKHRRAYVYAQYVKSPFLATVENGIDNAHLRFIHERTAQAPILIKPMVIDLNADGRGFRAWDDEEKAGPEYDEKMPLPGFEGLLLGIFSGLGEHTKYYFGYKFPGQFFHHFDFADGTMFATIGNATPCDGEHTWFFTDSVRTRGLNPLADLAHYLFGLRLSYEDQTAVNALVSRGPGGREDAVHVAADKPALAFRKIYARLTREEGRRAAWDGGRDLEPE